MLFRSAEALLQRGLTAGREAVLTAAVRAGDVRLIERLLASTSVDSAGLDGVTPLGAATSQGDLPMIRLLLSHGAKVNAVGKDGDTALHKAAELGALDVVDALLAAGADQDLLDRSGRTPRGRAVLARQTDVVERLTAARERATP